MWSRNAATALLRNTFVSSIVFLFSLALLWLLVERFGVDEVAGAAVGFIAANSIHYWFGRSWIFRGTTRALLPGYAYFLVNGGIGLLITLLLDAAFHALTSIHYLVARIIVSMFAGLAMFLLNGMLNFRRI